jgi:hypothetical protein
MCAILMRPEQSGPFLLERTAERCARFELSSPQQSVVGDSNNAHSEALCAVQNKSTAKALWAIQTTPTAKRCAQFKQAHSGALWAMQTSPQRSIVRDSGQAHSGAWCARQDQPTAEHCARFRTSPQRSVVGDANKPTAKRCGRLLWAMQTSPQRSVVGDCCGRLRIVRRAPPDYRNSFSTCGRNSAYVIAPG